MIDYSDLPFLNACLNAGSTIFLSAGYLFIRRKQIKAHKFCMAAAVTISLCFLVSYLIYHFEVGSVRFTQEGAIRVFYFAILLTHTVLAMSLPVLVPITLVRALKDRFDQHRRIARVTFPIWLYVSFTGVLIYLMLYQWYR